MLQLVEHIAEVEEGERVFGIGCGSLAIEVLGFQKLALVVVDSAQIDTGRRMHGVEQQDFTVAGGSFSDLVALFTSHGFEEEAVGAGFALASMEDGNAEGRGSAAAAGIKVEDELACDGFHGCAGMTEEKARA